MKWVEEELAYTNLGDLRLNRNHAHAVGRCNIRLPVRGRRDDPELSAKMQVDHTMVNRAPGVTVSPSAVS